MSDEFKFHKLNTTGIDRAIALQGVFDQALVGVKKYMPQESSRELSIVITKLQEACFFAKKGMAQDERFQSKDQ